MKRRHAETVSGRLLETNQNEGYSPCPRHQRQKRCDCDDLLKRIALRGNQQAFHFLHGLDFDLADALS